MNNMGKKKQKKHAFSEEEKQLIKELKTELSMMNVPREEWSSHVQQALKYQKRMNKEKSSSKRKTGFSRVFQVFREGIDNVSKKFLAKRFNLDKNALNGMFESPSEEEMKLMDSLSSGYKVKKAEELGGHGTFIMDRPNKKKMIVSFDDDDDD